MLMEAISVILANERINEERKTYGGIDELPLTSLPYWSSSSN
jgi:hypothetical protein